MAESLIFESEFNPQKFISGVDQMIGSLNKLSDQQSDLQQELDNTTKSLNDNSNNLSKVNASIKALDSTTEDYKKNLSNLTAEQQKLQSQQDAYNKNIGQIKSKIDDNKKSIDNYTASLKNVNVAINNIASGGKSFLDAIDVSKAVTEVSEKLSKFKDILGEKIDTSTLEEFENKIASSKDEFDKLSEVIGFVEQNLSKLDQSSEEFKEISNAVSTGKKVLEEYGNVVANTEGKSKSFTSRLKELREQMNALESSGKSNTKEFMDMSIEAAKLQDQIAKTNARIKTLSSSTLGLDFGLAAVRAASAGYGILEATTSLLGIKNEDALKSIQRLNSIMVIMNGIEQLNTLFKKENVIATVGSVIATKAATTAQVIYTTVVGASTGAMKALKIAMLGTGIGALIGLLGFAASAMGLFGSSTKETTEDNEAFTKSLEDVQSQLDSFNRFNQTNTAVNEERLKRQGASEQELFENRINGLTKEKEETRKAYEAIRKSQDDYLNQGRSEGDFIEKGNQLATQLFNKMMSLDDQITIEKEKNLTKQQTDFKKSLDNQVQLYSAYLDKLNALQRQLRDKQLAEAIQNEPAIRRRFENQLSDLIQDIQKDKKLTENQKISLKLLVEKINEVDLNKALKDYEEKVTKETKNFEKKLTDERFNILESRASLLLDTMKGDADAYFVNSQRQREQLKREMDDAINDVQAAYDSGSIKTLQEAQRRKDIIIDVYSDLQTELELKIQRQGMKLSEDVFNAGVENVKRMFKATEVVYDEQEAKEIESFVNAQKGKKTSYEVMQKGITDINKKYSDQRIQNDLNELEILKQSYELRLKNQSSTLTDKEKKNLEDIILDLRSQIAKLKAQLNNQDQPTEDEGGIFGLSPGLIGKLKGLAVYAKAIGSLTDSIVRFWTEANEAESRALDRSIALQEKRVQAATVIAEKGNAEYLKLEEDRLAELEVKREQAARRQLAINAVLQTSQALVAFTGAIAQAVTAGGNVLGAIGVAAAIIGLLASGYAIVQSLQPQVKLKKGTKKLKRDGHPSGVDTIPAMLTEGEAVIPKDINEDYESAVSSIYDRKIPPEIINSFVENYSNKKVPSLNYDLLDSAARVVIINDDRVYKQMRKNESKMNETNELLAKLNKSIKSIGVSLNIDRSGLAISLLEAVETQRISKRI